MVVICISSIRFICGWVNRTEERRWSAAGAGCFGTNCPKVQAYKNARTAWRYADADKYISCCMMFNFMSKAGMLRRRGYAFFSWCRSWALWKSKMDTADEPPIGCRVPASRHRFASAKKRRLWNSKPPFQIGVSKCLLYDGFFSFAVVRQVLFHISIQIKLIHIFSQQHISGGICYTAWLPIGHTFQYFPMRLPLRYLPEDWELESESCSGTETSGKPAQYAASYGYWS